MSREAWRPIPGFDGYEASDLGRVRSVSRITAHARYGARRTPGKVLRAAATHTGHQRVKIAKQLVMVHRLVLLAFVGPAAAGQYGCHNDGNPRNNVLTNLRWDTPAANVRDRIAHGTYQDGQRNPMSRTWMARRALPPRARTRVGA